MQLLKHALDEHCPNNDNLERQSENRLLSPHEFFSVMLVPSLSDQL